MTRHSAQVITQVKKLRKNGMSIPEIMLATGLSKTTIWHHVQQITLSEVMLKKIRSKQGGSKKRYIEAVARARLQSAVLLSSRYREICLLCAMLYWAEGSKRELVFTNTDVSMVNLYLKFIREILLVPESDIGLLIRISDPIVPTVAQKYWSNNTRVSLKRVTISKDNIQNKTKTTYGICRINVKKNSYYLKIIQCIIDAVKKDMLP